MIEMDNRSSVDMMIKGLTLGGPSSQFTTIDAGSSAGNRRYDSLSGSTRIDYMELDKMLNNG